MPDSKHQNTHDLLENLARRALKAGASAADALLVDGESLSVSCRLGELENLERSEGGDIGLRVFVGQRQAIVSSSDRSPQALQDLVERAIAMAKVVPEDPFAGLADPSLYQKTLPETDSADFSTPTVETLTDMARKTEATALAIAGVSNSEGAQASWSRSHVTLVTSNGFSHIYPVSRSGCGVYVVARDAHGAMEGDYASTSAVYFSDLKKPADLGAEAGERAVRRLGGQRLATGIRPVVFDPRVARGLLGHFLGAINGASIVRGTSFLKDSLGKAVFSDNISIIEDPLRPRGLRSRPCDAEGVPTRKRVLVEEGVLNTWLLDSRSARALGLQSTGHASRGVSSPPSPAASNVWLQGGSDSPEELMTDISDGLYVTDLFGQAVNGLTGDYSRGAAGFRIENGKLTTPVNEVTIAGTLQAMFSRLRAANDLEFLYGLDAPTVRIDDMMIAGSQA